MQIGNPHKFYGQFEPPVDKFLFERYFFDSNCKGIFVECGAFDGETESSCKFFEETLGWHGYNLEPVPWIWERLCANRSHSSNLKLGLSKQSGRAQFQAVNHPTFGINCTNGSLNHTESHRKFLEEVGAEFIEIEVELLTWRDFVARENISVVDLMVLDVEGLELEVIEGMVHCDVLPGVLCVEVGHISLDKIRKQLAQLNYVYDTSSHVNAYFLHRDYLNTLIFQKMSQMNNSVSLFNEKDQLLKEQLMQSMQDQQKFIQKLQEHNHSLSLRLHELTNLYQAIVTSKSWKLLDKLKRIRSSLSFWSCPKRG
jgi:FkbM family methyltransferase